jgi:hypothetical protein
MNKPIDPIDDEEDRRTRRASLGDIYQHYFQPQVSPGTDWVHKRDLSPEAISRLDRTESAAKCAIAATDLASPADRMQSHVDVSKRKPPGSNAVASAATSAGLTSASNIRSLFDLSSSMGKREKEQRDETESSRETVRAMLENMDLETVRELNKLFSTVSKPESAPLRSESRPQLEPPKGLDEETGNKTGSSYLRLVLDTHGSMEEMISACTDDLDAKTRRNMDELGKLQEDKIKAIEEYTRELTNKESWGTLQTLARYLAYASSLTIGVSLISSAVASPAGYLLIAAGGLGLVGSIASDTGLWTSLAAHLTKSVETQKQLAQSIELAVNLIPLGLGLTGSLMASPAYAPTAFAWMSAALSASAKLGGSWSEKKFNEILAKVEEMNTKILLVQEESKALSSHMKQTLEMARLITQETTRILSDSEISLS